MGSTVAHRRDACNKMASWRGRISIAAFAIEGIRARSVSKRGRVGPNG